MIAAILIIIVIGVAVAIVGSHRNLTATGFVVLFGCFGVAMAVGLVCNALEIPRHEWQHPIVMFAPLPVLGLLAAYAGQGEAIGRAEVSKVVGGMVAHRRRLSSVRADVRRQVNQYRIEVN